MKNSQDRTNVRQNDSYTASRKHAANLRRNPTLHFQVGLILALLVAIFFMEVKMPTKAYKADSMDYDIEEAVWDQSFQAQKKVVEVKIPEIKEPAPQPTFIDDVTQVKNDTELIETVLKGTSEPEIDTPMIDPNAGVTYIEIDDPIEDVDFRIIEEVPLFPGCEGLNSNAERRDCMSSKISKFVNKKFDTGLGADLGLQGINRIFVQFTVDKTGAITNIKSRGPHDMLEEEAARVINLLPHMKPGKQRSVPVGVIYNLPIKFKVQD